VLPEPINTFTVELEAVEREDGIAVVHLGEDGVTEFDFHTWAAFEESDGQECTG
jgi:hypothetical protein